MQKGRLTPKTHLRYFEIFDVVLGKVKGEAISINEPPLFSGLQKRHIPKSILTVGSGC